MGTSSLKPKVQISLDRAWKFGIGTAKWSIVVDLISRLVRVGRIHAPADWVPQARNKWMMGNDVERASRLAGALVVVYKRHISTEVVGNLLCGTEGVLLNPVSGHLNYSATRDLVRAAWTVMSLHDQVVAGGKVQGRVTPDPPSRSAPKTRRVSQIDENRAETIQRKMTDDFLRSVFT